VKKKTYRKPYPDVGYPVIQIPEVLYSWSFLTESLWTAMIREIEKVKSMQACLVTISVLMNLSSPLML